MREIVPKSKWKTARCDLNKRLNVILFSALRELSVGFDIEKRKIFPEISLKKSSPYLQINPIGQATPLVIDITSIFPPSINL